MRGGLGKKQLTLFEHDGPSELHGEIMLAFPKLKDGGGYELYFVLVRVETVTPFN